MFLWFCVLAWMIAELHGSFWAFLALVLGYLWYLGSKR